MYPVIKLALGTFIRTSTITGKNLYAKGNILLLSRPHLLGVIGSRDVSEYGKHVIPYILKNLDPHEIVIVSGLSRGIDYLAHTFSLQSKFKNIAVLPCGINYIYPVSHSSLVSNLLESEGLLLSEYEGCQTPRDWTFIERNKIIAQICDALLVIEAGERSGSLSTARWALKLRKKVFVIPGDIFRKNSVGITQLLTEGATACHSSRQINDYFGINPLEASEPTKGVNAVSSYINQKPSTAEELAVLIGKPLSEIFNTLIELELTGKVYNIGGIYHAC